MKRALLLVTIAGLVTAIVVVANRSPDARPTGPEPPAEAGELHGLPRSRFLIEHDRFLAATDPRVLPAEEARWLNEDSEVFGVVLDNEARAYPIPMIAYHHVVNDRLAGIPITVTY